ESDYDYLVNDNFGPADAYLFVLTNWSNSIEHDLTPYKHIIALRNKVAERQSVQIAMRDEGLIS
ncbi:glutathione binding-like protein, partial [Klebsiella pneumoniae]|nr:glutathione binding-like protein [Klebsiella pneumoniae]